MASDADTVLVVPAEDPATALDAAQAELSAAGLAGDDRLKALSSIKVADMLSLSGKAQDAINQANAALESCEDLKLDVGRGAALGVIARICAAHGGTEDDVELGFDSAQDALRLFRKLKEPKGEAMSLWSMAQMEVSFGKGKRAVDLSKEAMAIFQELGDAAAETAACETIADAYVTTREPRKAAQALSRAAAIQAAQGNKLKEAACLHRLARVWLQADDDGQAAEALAKARGLYKELRDSKAEAAVLATQKEMHLGAGRFADAVGAAKEVVSLYNRAGDKAEEGRGLLRIAELFLENNDTEKAMKMISFAHTVLQEAHNMEAMNELSEMFGAVRHAQAKQEMHRAIEANADFIHVPAKMVVDPGFNKRIQESWKEATKTGVF
uniref:MalT-like TPR region domain-containing protein n=1 Tax=Zooxanthella nutricula TaxID=1333877 RepID=A0A7S2VL79_9DINO